MDDFPSAAQLQSLVAALRALITPGVYAAALETSPLIDLPAVEARAGPDAPRTVRAQAFIELLESVVNVRLSTTDRQAASILFGIGTWSGMPVRERHYEVAKLRNKRWTWERNYRKEPLTRDLLTVLRALIREDGAAPEPEPAAAGEPAGDEPAHEARHEAGSESEAEYHLRRLGRRRTAYPLDMSLEQLQQAGLIVPVKLGRYHERQASRQASDLDEVVRCLENGSSVLLLGEPGAGKTLAMYQLATACTEAGMTPIPIRARDTAEVVVRDGWRDVREQHGARVVVLLDGLDEAVELIAQNREQFAADLQELLSAGPYVVSSRVREYEELISGGFPDPGFDVVYVIEPWTLETEFREYLSRLAQAGLLNEPTLYEAVVGSDDLARLVSRPLYARMLTFVGEQGARGLRDQVSLYGEYLTKLARVTDYSLESQGVQSGGALQLWQAAAWIIYSSGGADDMIPLADVEQRLPDLLPRPYAKRVLDQIIERGSSHGRETGEFIHYSFYEYLVAREAYDRILRNPGPEDLAEILKGDFPREIRHYLIGQLRMSNDADLRETLLGSYASARRVLNIPDTDRLSVCNLLIYLISRVFEASEEWLHGLLAEEDDPFLRHSILWAMCHVGSGWALREFAAELAARPDARSECRGYMLYYYGDLPRGEGPPYHDEPPHAVDCSLTYRRVMDMFGQDDFTAEVAPERCFIDMYLFLDLLVVRGGTLEPADSGVLAAIMRSMRDAGLPAALLTRLGKLAARAGLDPGLRDGEPALLSACRLLTTADAACSADPAAHPAAVLSAPAMPSAHQAAPQSRCHRARRGRRRPASLSADTG